MMKRDELVKAIYSGLIKDCCRSYPGDTRSLDRDLVRLLQNTDKLSHFFYSIEMLKIGHAFRRALEVGNLTPLYGVNHCKLAKGTPYPLLFVSLWRRVFSTCGGIMPNPDPKAIFFLQQFFFCFKKLEGTCGQHLDQKVIDEFFTLESHIRKPTLQWNVGNFDPDSNLHLCDATDYCGDGLTPQLFPSDGNALVDLRLPERCQLIADILFGSFSEYKPEEYQCRHGPGAVSDKPRTGDKYSFGTWPSRLDSLFAYDAHATVGLDESPEYLDHEHPAKLICVPKDSRGPRLIASEPSYLQFAQQSINSYLREKIGSSCISRSINFVDQAFSQEGAIKASIDRSSATVDLKSASDLLSLWMVERLIRKNKTLLHAIYATRSRYATDGKGRSTFINKVAPMGNAYIFPLQTAIYTIAAIAALSISNGESTINSKTIRRLAKEVRVFGDDIILPTRAYGYLVSLLTFMGMQVNTQKSFSEGSFREACGVDAFQGYNVTPAYIKAIPSIESPETVISSVDCVNNLTKVGLHSAAYELRLLIPRQIRNRIIEVRSGSGAFGFQASQPSFHKWRTRFNRALQIVEVLCLTPSSRVEVRKREGIRNYLQYVTERPRPDMDWESGTVIPRDQRMRSRWVPIRNLG